MNRKQLESRARMGDTDALIELLEHDLRSRGATATVSFEQINPERPHLVDMRVDGFYYGGFYTKESALRNLNECIENGTLAVSLKNWATGLKRGELPWWLEQVHQTDKELCW